MSGIGTTGSSHRPRIICLLPVRNAADTLPDWLDHAHGFADAVVALDDGSTDATGEILAAHPLVAAVITNQRREGYLGWHDGRNRNRLLAAAAALGPDWILSVDADERIDASDAHALRQFVANEAIPGCAYGFQLYRMHADGTFDPNYERVYRLFPYRAGGRFHNRRLDVIPVPTEIGPDRWVETTLRVQHFGDGDEAGRDRRLARFREADPEGAFREYYDNLRPLAPGPFPRWRPRAPEVPLLFGAGDRPWDSVASPHVVCLLPARNCAHLLPGWFDSISRVADAIVALDDGSTDGTGDLLRGHPLVTRVLTNPVRPDFEDWDDGDNRNRLLAAAAELSPTWVISVDADERIPLADAAALRRFLHHGAERGCGYALASFRMIGDEDHFDRLDYDAYRLFAWEPGHVFPSDRLHAPPIPTAIPPDRWRQTTIRMKHLVSLTEADRRARREKFRQADPDCVWEPDYEYTVDPPGEVRVWEERPLDLDPLVGTTTGLDDDLDIDGPVLTLVVAVNPGEEHEALAMLEKIAADGDDRVELAAATRDGYAAGVLRRDERIKVIDIGADWSDAGLRNTALAAARGDYVAFVDVGDRLNADGLAELIDAHESGHGVLSLAGAGAPTTPVEWAALLLASPQAGRDYVSFVKEPLRAIGGFDDWIPGGLGVGAANALLALGLTQASVTAIVRGDHQRPTMAGLLHRQYGIGRHGQPNGTSRAAAGWRRLTELDAAADAPRPLVAALIAAAATATRLGTARRRVLQYGRVR